MARRRTVYASPRNDAERLMEAQREIMEIERGMRQGDNRFGSYGANCRAAIARWQEAVTRNGGTAR